MNTREIELKLDLAKLIQWPILFCLCAFGLVPWWFFFLMAFMSIKVNTKPITTEIPWPW